MKLPFWGTLLTLLGVMILCALGGWRIKRLAWKQELLRAIDREYERGPFDVALSSDDLSSLVDMKRGYVVGRYAHDYEIWLQVRTYKGQPGYHVITPFELTDGRYILMNRGWIPDRNGRSDDFVLTRPEGVLHVSGILRHIPQDNFFVPDNDIEKDLWFRILPHDIEAYTGISLLAQNMIYVEQEGRPAAQRDYPVVSATSYRPNNNHQQYAIFWFTMALSMVAVYILRFIRPQLSKRG